MSRNPSRASVSLNPIMFPTSSSVRDTMQPVNSGHLKHFKSPFSSACTSAGIPTWLMPVHRPLGATLFIFIEAFALTAFRTIPSDTILADHGVLIQFIIFWIK